MILLIVIFIFFLLTQKNVSDSISRFFIWTFFVLWVGQSLLTQFGIYDNFIPHDNTIMYVAVHMLFFYVGFCSLNKKSKNVEYTDCQEKLHSLKQKIIVLSRNPVFVVLFILSFIFVVSVFGKYFGAIIAAQSISEARADNHLQELYGEGYYYVNMILIYPMSVLVSFLFAFKTFEKKDFLWLMMGLFLLMYKSLNGGRLGYLSIFIAIVFVAVYLQKYKQKKQLLFKRYSSFLLLGVFAIAFYFLIGLVTAGRQGDVSMSSSAFENSQETTNMHFFNYYVCPVVALDYTVNTPDIIKQQGGYHYGALTFNCVEETFYIILNKLGLRYNRPIGEYGIAFQDHYIDIGSMYWNALYTWCNYFYCDMGFLGLIFFPLILGCLVRKTILYFRKTSNPFSGAVLVLAYYVTSMSMVGYYFSGFTSFFSVMVLLYLSERKIIKVDAVPLKQ